MLKSSIPPADGALPSGHGSIAGRYRAERLLGRGGMGSVYAAFDPVTESHVALKVLKRDASREVLALFEREYQTLASLEHAKIVKVYEYGHAQGTAYYTMELLEGADLGGSAPPHGIDAVQDAQKRRLRRLRGGLGPAGGKGEGVCMAYPPGFQCARLSPSSVWNE